MVWKKDTKNNHSKDDSAMQQAFDVLVDGVKNILPNWAEYLKLQTKYRNVSFNNIVYLNEQIMMREMFGDPTAYKLMVKGDEQWLKEGRTIIESHKNNPFTLFAPKLKGSSPKKILLWDELIVGDTLTMQGTITQKLWNDGSSGLYMLQIEKVNGIDKSGYIGIIGDIADTVILQRSYTISGEVSMYKNRKQIKVENIHEIKLTSSYNKKVLIGYMLVNVYDISQTEGKDIPSVCNRLEGSSNEASLIIDVMNELIDIPIKVEVIKANGYFDPENLVIGTKYGLPNNQLAKTLIHEYSHYYVHKKKSQGLNLDDYAIKNDNDSLYAIEEVLVESIAFMCCHYFDLDTSDYSFGYVCSWSDGDVSAIKKVGKLIQNYAREVIDSMEDISNKLLNYFNVNQIA